jgi:dGTPase
VYSFNDDDQISNRIVHVQLVSKIARTIGRALNLNEDLIEAIALGHDIGHTPLGHLGEEILNEISLKELDEYFMHNVQSVRMYMEIEKKGEGINLTLQVLDGILCHNGEILSNIYKPVKKTKSKFLKEYQDSYKDKTKALKIKPMTLEGCVVRISDIIAYIGRDIEDASRNNYLNKTDIPQSITNILGNSNKEIINNLIINIIENSYNKPYIKLSKEIYNALNELKNFNYQNIYTKSNKPDDINYYRTIFKTLYKNYLNDIIKNNYKSDIYTAFLKYQNDNYIKNTAVKRQVLDFIAGMTDSYFLKCYKKQIKQKETLH